MKKIFNFPFASSAQIAEWSRRQKIMVDVMGSSLVSAEIFYFIIIIICFANLFVYQEFFFWQVNFKWLCTQKKIHKAAP